MLIFDLAYGLISCWRFSKPQNFVVPLCPCFFFLWNHHDTSVVCVEIKGLLTLSPSFFVDMLKKWVLSSFIVFMSLRLDFAHEVGTCSLVQCHADLSRNDQVWGKDKWLTGVGFYRNCAAVSVSEYNEIIWFYGQSWWCKLATVKSFKADVSRVRPSSKRIKEQLCCDFAWCALLASSSRSLHLLSEILKNSFEQNTKTMRQIGIYLIDIKNG